MPQRSEGQRRRLLVAALGFALLDLRPEPPALTVLKRWLDSWAGLGLVVTGMSRQGYQVSLGEHGPSVWIAVFYGGHGGHDLARAAGTAQEASPWRAVQRAAWQALAKAMMAKRRSASQPKPVPSSGVLPMELHVGDRFTDGAGEWEVAG